MAIAKSVEVLVDFRLRWDIKVDGECFGWTGYRRQWFWCFLWSIKNTGF